MNIEFDGKSENLRRWEEYIKVPGNLFLVMRSNRII